MFLQKNHKKKTSAQYLNPDAAAKEPILHAAIWQTLFFVLATVYFELVLHIITGGGELRTYGYLILFSIAYAMLPALLSLLPCGRLLNGSLLRAGRLRSQQPPCGSGKVPAAIRVFLRLPELWPADRKPVRAEIYDFPQ